MVRESVLNGSVRDARVARRGAVVSVRRRHSSRVVALWRALLTQAVPGGRIEGVRVGARGQRLQLLASRSGSGLGSGRWFVLGSSFSPAERVCTFHTQACIVRAVT